MKTKNKYRVVRYSRGCDGRYFSHGVAARFGAAEDAKKYMADFAAGLKTVLGGSYIAVETDRGRTTVEVTRLGN